MAATERDSTGKFTKRPSASDNGNEGDDNDAGIASGGVINPADLDGAADGDGGSDSAGNVTPRKRGRPRKHPIGGAQKSARMGKRPARQEDLVTTDLLFSVHAMLSAITKSPSLKLEEKECENLAKAANKVARHYEIHQTQKQLDWANLIMCLGATYAPRILMAKSKKASTKTGVSSVIQQNNDSLPEHNNITAISLGGAPMGVE